MTTLNQIRRYGPRTELLTRLLKHLGKTQGDDEPLSLLTVLNSNGLDDAIWCLRTEPTPERIQRFALAIARRVEHLNPAAKACNDVTERYINGTATKAELEAATYVADVALVADTAYAAANAVVYATADTAYAAADAAHAIVLATAYAKAYASDAAADAAADDDAAAAYTAAYAAECEAQIQIFKGIFA